MSKTKIEMPARWNEKKIDSETASVAAAVGGIGKRLHDLAVQCLLHAMPVDQGGTGDARKMDNLLKSLTIGADERGRRKSIVHVEGIVAWCAAFSPIVWNADGNVKLLKPDSKNYNWDLAKAIKTPFWMVVGQASVTPFTIQAMLKIMAGLGKRLQTAIENDRFEGNKAQAEEVASLAEKTATTLAKKLGIDMDSARASSDTRSDTNAKDTAKRIVSKVKRAASLEGVGRGPKKPHKAEGTPVAEAA